MGVDVVAVARFAGAAADPTGPRGRLFTPDEHAHAARAPDRAATYAGLFAAKEAVLKALPDERLTTNDVAVAHDERGRPRVLVRGVSRPDVDVSISHDGGVAVAAAVAG